MIKNCNQRTGFFLSVVSSIGLASLGILLATRIHLVDTFDQGMLAVFEVLFLFFSGILTLITLPQLPCRYGVRFTEANFGFLGNSYGRGFFYLFIGIHAFPIVPVITYEHEDVIEILFRVLAGVCMVCGIMLMIIGCQSSEKPEGDTNQRLTRESNSPPSSIGKPVPEPECPPMFA